MNEIPANTEFLKAFVKVQAELQPAKKNSKNPHFKSNFADLSSCYDACRKLLSQNGLCVMQVPWLSEDGVTMLRTHLLHISGGGIVGEIYVCPKDVTSQVRGSALTYARRYALITMVGISSDDDDDGNIASNYKPAPVKKIEAQAPLTPGDFIVQIGSNKGKKIKDISKVDLEKSLEWCITNEKYPDYQAALLNYLDSITQKDISFMPEPRFED